MANVVVMPDGTFRELNQRELLLLERASSNALQLLLEQLKNDREELIQSDLTGFSMRNPSDIVNIQQTIDGLDSIPTAKVAGLIPNDYPETVNFRKADNTFQSMTLQDMRNLYLQYLLRKQQAWSSFETAVNALTNPN